VEFFSVSLEDALSNIKGVADVLWDLGAAGEDSVAYLAHRLKEHHEDAYGAFSRIYKMGEHREREAQS
jgi:hypothetical protein